MKKIFVIYIGIFLSFFLLLCRDTASQSSYTLDNSNSKMTILGTSSLHDWKMDVNDFKCTATLITQDKNISEMQFVEFSCIPTNIVSEYKLMDKKTYEALKAEEFSNINFKGKKGRIISRSGNEFNGMISGNLFIAGQTKEINIPFQGNLLENGKIEVKGKVNLKLSDFKIDPPTAMMGTLKTGDEISIVYSFEFESPENLKQVSEIKTGNSISN
jgi:polyisoprenoid-binding protein YceI